MENDFNEMLKQLDDDDPSKYMRIDEFSDVQCSLRMLENTLEMVQTEPFFWKWVILSAHSSVQGACVCLLTQKHLEGALSETNKREWVSYNNLESQRAITESSGGAWILGDAKPPDTFVAALPELLRRLPEKIKVILPKKPNTMASTRRGQDFQCLHWLRNQFTHFESITVSLEVAGLPRIIGEALSLIEQIVVSDQLNPTNGFQELEIDAIIGKCRLLLAEIELPSP